MTKNLAASGPALSLSTASPSTPKGEGELEGLLDRIESGFDSFTEWEAARHEIDELFRRQQDSLERAHENNGELFDSFSRVESELERLREQQLTEPQILSLEVVAEKVPILCAEGRGRSGPCSDCHNQSKRAIEVIARLRHIAENGK